jgi:hypothetical protein
VPWPGQDLSILAFAVLFLMVGLLTVRVIKSPTQEATS